MSKVAELMKASGYSARATEYYLNKVSVGVIETPSVHSSYTGPCGDTLELYLKIESDIIEDAKFQAIGCAGAFSSGSALMEMIKGKTLEEAKKITEEDIIDFLGGIPKQKFHCTCLAKRALQMALKKYKKTRDTKSNQAIRCRPKRKKW
jgi:NifU-like protein involved in Fe-S cluster formation